MSIHVPEARRSEESEVELSLYTGQEFFIELSRDIARTEAGDRVAITTMDFDARDPHVEIVLDELYAAAEREVTIGFSVDAFAHLNPRRTIGPLVLPFGLNEEARRYRLDPLRKLGEFATARYGITNRPNEPVMNMFAGRSHIKLAIVNNKVYLGGPSFQGSDRLDMVVGFEDETTANTLYNVATAIVETEDTTLALGRQDTVWQVDPTTKVIMDAGQPDQSASLDEALRIVDEAMERITISSPFLLTGIMNEHLIQAYEERDVDVYIAYNHVSKYEQMRLVHLLIQLKQRMRNPSAFFDHQVPKDMPALHAKVVANEHEAMVASQNFVETSVKFGTSEIALVRRSAAFASAVRALLLSQVQTPTTLAKVRSRRLVSDPMTLAEPATP